MPPSGRRVIAVLQGMGFDVVTQVGSHVKLRRVVNGQDVMVTVPLHKEVKRGTLSGIAKQVGLTLRELEALA